jgi:hypothetical protein
MTDIAMIRSAMRAHERMERLRAEALVESDAAARRHAWSRWRCAVDRYCTMRARLRDRHGYDLRIVVQPISPAVQPAN